MPDISPSTSWVQTNTNPSSTWVSAQIIPSNIYKTKQILIFGSSRSSFVIWNTITAIWGD
tara:strand:- start:411 stop:590 length:180 start_codon:yes stop_codon:yes gene_type:complete